MSDQDALLRSARKHLFILSSSGKPVYSRLGDESDLVTTFGLLQVIREEDIYDDRDRDRDGDRDKDNDRDRERDVIIYC